MKNTLTNVLDVVLTIGLVVVSILIYAFIYGLPVMLLWNWLMVNIFELPKISFFEAVGIFILFNILFSSVSKGKSEN